MSQENVEIVRRMYDAFNRGDPAAAEYLHPEAEMHQLSEVPDAQSYYGREEFVRGLGVWLSGWEEFRFEPEEMTQVGDHVVMQVRLWGRGRGSGVETTMRWFHVWTIRDRKPHTCVVRTTREEALKVVIGPRE
jgi:ketosteroid isomerase-like protein